MTDSPNLPLCLCYALFTEAKMFIIQRIQRVTARTLLVLARLALLF